jgi:hypothetical protein
MSKLSTKIALLMTVAMATSVGFAEPTAMVPAAAPTMAAPVEAAATKPADKKKKQKVKKTTAQTIKTAPVAELKTTPAVNPAGSAATPATAVAAPEAAGSSTAAIPAAAPTGLAKFSGSLIVEGSASQNSWRDNGASGRIETFNAATLTYKISPTNKVSLRHYFSWNRDEVATGKASLSDNQTQPQPTYLRFHQAVGEFMGADKSEILFWATLPTNDYTVTKDANATLLRADYVPTWTITPKWAFSYILSPRMNVVSRDNQYETYDAASKSFTMASLRTSLRAVHGPQIGYTINDTNSVYLAPYLDQEFDYNNSLNYTKKKKKKSSRNSADGGLGALEYTDTENTIARNNFNIELGYNFDVKLSPRSTLSFNPYLAKSGIVLDRDMATADTRAYDADDLSYNLAVSLSL